VGVGQEAVTNGEIKEKEVGAASVTLFGNVVAGFAMSGPTETLELEQIAEEIRGHINMDDNNKSK